MNLLGLVLRLVEEPLRFLLVNGMLVVAFSLAVVEIRPQDGYPWPGFIAYGLPRLPVLFLGTMLAVGLAHVRILAPIRSWGRLLTFLLAAAACSALLGALTPSSGLLGGLCLVALAVVATSAFARPPRRVLAVRLVLVAFVMLLVRFVVLPGAAEDALGKALGLARSAGAGQPGRATETVLYLGLLLFLGAVALQWPSQEPSPAEDEAWLFVTPAVRAERAQSLLGPSQADGSELFPGEERPQIEAGSGADEN